MSARYFTSDWHIGSSHILQYAKRPFKNPLDAYCSLKENCMHHLKDDHGNIVFHVGDFLLKNTDRHDKKLGPDVNDSDSLLTYEYCMLGLSNEYCRFVLLAGNHDDGHSCETDIKTMTIDLNQNYRNVFVSHYPSTHKYYYGPMNHGNQLFRVNLCGHVHDKWLMHYDECCGVLNINVGVDVWNYRPVEDVELTEMLDKVVRNAKHGIWLSEINCWTRADFDEANKTVEKKIVSDREKRKAERYARKGLTPEECERRKQAALKAKKNK